MKLATILALLGFACGLLSSYFWLRSSRAQFELNTISIIASGTPVIAARDLEDYLSRVGHLNSFAAALGACAVLLTTISGLLPRD